MTSSRSLETRPPGELLAQRDPLTGRSTRAALAPDLAAALERACRSGDSVALVYTDLNEFKRVNDGLGHAIGDELLRQVAARLLAVVRPGDLVARLGGDEFVVVAADLPRGTQRSSEAVGQRVADALAEPYRLGALDLQVDASVGVSVFPDDADSAESLLKHADAAMYEAKAAPAASPIRSPRTASIPAASCSSSSSPRGRSRHPGCCR